MNFLFIDFHLPYLLRDASYPVGGWAVELLAWIKGLRADGHEVGVLTWKGANRFVDNRLDFELIEAYDPTRGVKGVKYLYDYIPALQRCAAGFAPDVMVQACAELYTGIMSFIARRRDVPFVYRVANDMDTDGRYRKGMPHYARLSYRYGLKNAAAVVCQNQYQYDNIRQQFPQKPAATIPNPFLKTVDVPPIPVEKRKYIAWLGVFKNQKNLPLLYDIARLMPDREFKVAGMPGKKTDEKTVNALARLERLSNVNFVGYLSREQVYSFLGKARMLLNTSHYEGFSNAFLESFSVGTPVVAPAHADPDGIIRRNGLGLTAEEETAFLPCIERLFTQDALFNEISGVCLKYVNMRHDPLILARRLVDFVRQVKDA